MATPTFSLSLWKEAFGDEERPTIYSSTKPQKRKFAVLSSPKKFMRDLEPLSQTQLYALTENNQLALKTAQDEYLHIEHLIRGLEQKDPPSNPQILLDPDRFEEEKEATLYGYKRVQRGMPYTRTKVASEFYGFQEPFSQGGFVPTDAQYKRMKANAKDPKNIDGWIPIERDGKMLIPRMPRSPPPRQRGFTGTLTRPSRKRRLAEQGFSDTDATAAMSDSDAFDTPSKHVTRFLGRKIPPTRDPSETPVSHRGSPTPSRHHKFMMNNLTAALLNTSTSHNHLSTTSTPFPPDVSPSPSTSPSKRRRMTPQPSNHKPRPRPSSSTSINDPEDKRWTDSSLILAINTDHSFLHPEPAIALAWKTAILNAPNPVRSYAMKRKWAWWRKGGMDKRPRRGWREGTGDESMEDRLGEGSKDEIQERVSGTKLEDLRELRVKKEENEEKMDQGNYNGTLIRMYDSRPERPCKRPPVTNETNEDKKRSIAMKQQKDRQFTFKLDHPPPLRPPSSSLWTTDQEAREVGGGTGGTRIHKIERIFPRLFPGTAGFRQREGQAPPPN
jgi:hypothetical protein